MRWLACTTATTRSPSPTFTTRDAFAPSSTASPAQSAATRRRSVTTGQETRLGVSREAVTERNGLAGVYTGDGDNKARFTLVKLGKEYGDVVQVLSGLDEGQQVLVANADQLLAVASWAEPAFWPELVDRYLIAAQRYGLKPIICLNKVDLAPDLDECRQTLRPYRDLGYRLIYASTLTGLGVAGLKGALAGHETVLAGLSGVGKSSLLKAIQPSLALRIAAVNLRAEPAPAGVMDVVLGPGWPGILLHEAIGHGLEGDFNRKGTSAFAGRIGEQVAAKGITVVDDGTLEQRRGSLSVDDEGTQTQCTTLIEDGILKGYLFDRQNAALMGTQSTGNGRRQSYAHLPMPRMTNTYMRAGQYDPNDIIASVEKGIYAVNFSGGQVDITSGKFVFSASEAYQIENGKIGKPLKNATLIGNGPDVLTRVSMVGNDLQLDTGIGVCGKDGQSVPVGVGQPTLRIDGITVGGTATA